MHALMTILQQLHARCIASQCAVGPFETVRAENVRTGDLLVLMADPQDAASQFFATAVSLLEPVSAEGMYVPAIESPYIIADGVVAPL